MSPRGRAVVDYVLPWALSIAYAAVVTYVLPRPDATYVLAVVAFMASRGREA